MTLVELVVVLGILAALAGVALTYVNETGEAGRRDLTRARLDQIETAIAGTPTAASRFLSDMGRLPVATYRDAKGDFVTNSNDADLGYVLSELWNGDVFKFAYAVEDDVTPRVPTPFVDYAGYQNEWESLFPATVTNKDIRVILDCGWRGPYLSVPGKKFYDGFGNEFEVNADIVKDSGEDWAWPEDSVLEVGSFGADGKEDQSYPLPRPSTNSSEVQKEWKNRDDLRKIQESQVLSKLCVRVLVRDNSAGTPAWLPAQSGFDVKDYDGGKNYHVGEIVRPGNLLHIPGEGDDDPGTTYSSDCTNYDLFMCVKQDPETTGSQHPNWKRTETTIDAKGNRWQWLPNSNKITHLRAAVFSPYVDTKTAATIAGKDIKGTGIRVTTAMWEADDPQWLIDRSVSGSSGDYVRYTYGWSGSTLNEDFENIGDIDGTGTYTEADVAIADKYPAAAPRIYVDGTSPGELTFHNLTPGVRKLCVYGYLDVGGVATNAHHSGIITVDLKPGVNFITVYLNEPFF